MKKTLVHQLQRQVVKSYGAVAADFDRTREKPWPEFHHFLGYVRRGARVLDAGCGNGRLAGFLSEKKVDYMGVDNNSALLSLASRRFPSARFELADFMDPSFGETGAFDNLFCVAAFHHVPGRAERRRVADTFHRLLREDGLLVLTVWNLFQWRYAGALFRAILSFLLHLGLGCAWNDVFIRWADASLPRYYHAFLPSELRRCFPDDLWEVLEFYGTRKGERVPFWRSFNFVLIARKISGKD